MDSSIFSTLNKIVNEAVTIDNEIQSDRDEEERSGRSNFFRISKRIRARAYKACKRNGSGGSVVGRKYTNRKRITFANHL